MTIILNGKKAKDALLETAAASLCDSRILAAKGGFLFRSASEGDVLHLGIIPCLDQGERNYHYNIALPDRLEFVLIGSINAQGIFTVLFKPKTRELTDAIKAAYRRNYLDLADALISRGYRGPGEFDAVTRGFVEKAGIFPIAPVSLVELHAWGQTGRFA